MRSRDEIGVMATSVGGIAGNVETLATAATPTTEGVEDSPRASSELARMSSDLRSLVGSFRV
ncbi:hypothetical protein ACIA5C_38110 [Actinoplanes sp. NPDC051343]|uniref:hypothetical protein n=1 Tax=Actinoplanes sp. NPDC051343 TaxID=3363906 RepID=UPI0037ABC357